MKSIVLLLVGFQEAGCSKERLKFVWNESDPSIIDGDFDERRLYSEMLDLSR